MKTRPFLLALTLASLAVTALPGRAQATYEPYTFTTLAGYGFGSADGTGSAARFRTPFGVAVDGAGNVYVADQGNNTIRKVTPLGVVTTLAGMPEFSPPPYGDPIGGSADGTGSAARFRTPFGVAVDGAGNVYVADSDNNTIRKVTPLGVVTTLAGLAQWDSLGNYVSESPGSADGTGSDARFGRPSGVAVDGAGNLYVADTYNDTIRKVTPLGVVTTLAGLAGKVGSADGTGSDARFEQPTGVAVDGAGNVYVADTYNYSIRKGVPAVGAPQILIQPQSQTVTVGYATTLQVLANGTLPLTYQWRKDGVALAGATNASYRIAEVQGIHAGAYSVVVGNPDGTATSSNAVLTVALPPYTFTTLAGSAQLVTYGYPYTVGGSADGTGSAAGFYQPAGVAVDGAGNVYVADSYNCTIRKVTPLGVVTTLAGLAGSGGSADGTGSDARFNQPFGVAVDGAGNVYVADGNSTIRKVTPLGTNWVVTTLAGLAQRDTNGVPVGGSADGTGSAARFSGPAGVAVDGAGNVYVADQGNHTIRKVTPLGVVTTLAGLAQSDTNGVPVGGSADGTGSAARFLYPSGVAVDGAGNVYVADSGNNTIRKVMPLGVVTTLAGLAGSWGSADGTGSAARFSGPAGVAVDGAGNVYVADSSDSTIRKVTPLGTNWVVTTLAGLAGSDGYADGTGSAARFYLPRGLAVAGAGNLYVADGGNSTIRKGLPALMILNSGAGFGFHGGRFGFQLTGPTGRPVVVEASSDLVSWSPIWTNTFAGDLPFSDPQGTNQPVRLYRLRTP